MASPANQRDGGYILALDVGTSSFHCLLVDLSARPIAAASAPIRYFTPDGCPTLAKEFDPEVAVDTLGWLTGKILNDTGTKAGDISAIGITSQRQGLVFLDRSGKEIYSGPNLDLRAVFEGAEIDEQFGAEFYLTTGHFPSLLFAPARFRWFREHCCPIYQETTTILPIAGWLAYRLTGSPVSELSLEGEAGLLDIRTRARCVDLMGKLGVPDSLLPPLSSLDVPAGVLSHHIAAEWGLDEGIPVVVAGPDAQCGLLGMGLNKGGQAGVVMGWSGALQVLTSAPLLDGKEMRTWAGCYPLEGLWVAESNLGDAGNAYRWLKDTILDDNASFEEAELLAQEASAGAEGVVAFLGPGPQSPVKTGLKIGGLLFPTPLTFHEVTRGQLLRAALDNVAYSVKSNLGVLREVTGIDPQLLYLGGGMATGRTLASIMASVLGFPVRRSVTPHVSARGAALAAIASIDPSLPLGQLAEAAANDFEEVEPGSASEMAQHQEYYQQWLDSYRILEGVRA